MSWPVITDNVRDFPPELLEPFGVQAVTADAFALSQVDLHAGAVVESLAAMAARRRRDPKTPDEIAQTLSRYLPNAMAALLHRIELRVPDPSSTRTERA